MTYRVALNFAGNLFLRVNDFFFQLYFAGTNFCNFFSLAAF